MKVDTRKSKKRDFGQKKTVVHVCELLKCLDGLRIIECNRVLNVTMFCKTWHMSDGTTQI